MEIETEEEKHIRRSREPELKWSVDHTPLIRFGQEVLMLKARSKKSHYNIMSVDDKLFQLTYNDVSFKPARERIKHKEHYWNKTFDDIDITKHYAMEHWRGKGYA